MSEKITHTTATKAPPLKIGVTIMRAFVEVRRVLLQQSDLKEQLKELKDRVCSHDIQPIQVYKALENIPGEKAAA
ncbi:hypothetical protein FW774_12595 [Pedobacter sp. BS3]|uniref:hypothetical protein n=1 Tax=Pedobacter sp. BS3 TaxID=2567937 RepID=UPI0011EE538A|nr:hypothetical protein [Pedobacter sp. BS3]TZF83133.1 hypothetical protein FW774_12595 [Pedobacter sp. BS3]